MGFSCLFELVYKGLEKSSHALKIVYLHGEQQSLSEYPGLNIKYMNLEVANAPLQSDWLSRAYHLCKRSVFSVDPSG